MYISNSSQEWLDHLRASTALPEGFRASTTSIEFFPPEKPGSAAFPMRLSLIVMDQASQSFATMFTRNAFPGAPIVVGKKISAAGFVQGILINNKVSNVGTENGVADSERLTGEVCKQLGLEGNYILPSSTGIIGWSLPAETMSQAIPTLCDQLGTASAADLAQAIMTTDSFAKAVTVKVGEGSITGIAKGAGMIEPNLATMLVFLMTDLSQGRPAMESCLSQAVEASFNCISIDSDQSTSDTCVLLSSRKKPGVSADLFAEALGKVCNELAAQIVRNGEGTSHVLRVSARGFGDYQQCRDLAKAIVNSPLVKTAVYGNDPNVGRIIAAAGDFLGNRGHSLDASRLRIFLGDYEVFSAGSFKISSETEKNLSDMLLQARIDPDVHGYPQHERYVDIKLIMGEDNRGNVAVVLGSDLGYEYVRENADYRS